MSDPIRAAIERLHQYAEIFPVHDTDAILAAARAALAELASDGPAVPESREPASVAGKSSDENCWQWYTYCPEEGLEMYSDRKQAQSAAQSIMGSYEVAAHSDGWHEDMELVSWGMLVPVEQAQVVERKTAEPDDEFDEWVKYELRPARWGHQPTPPAEGEVGELVKYLRGVKSLHCQRAAELLQQQHPAPVPVSERLPGPEDCDGEGRCWAGTRAFVDTSGDRDIDYPPSWELREVRAQDDVWLPAHALPLPQGEVE